MLAYEMLRRLVVSEMCIRDSQHSITLTSVFVTFQITAESPEPLTISPGSKVSAVRFDLCKIHPDKFAPSLEALMVADDILTFV